MKVIIHPLLIHHTSRITLLKPPGSFKFQTQRKGGKRNNVHPGICRTIINLDEKVMKRNEINPACIHFILCVTY